MPEPRLTEAQRLTLEADIEELARVLEPEAFDPDLNWEPGVRAAKQNLASVHALKAILAGWRREREVGGGNATK